MSGHVGLREDALLGHSLAQRIAALFPPRCMTCIGRVPPARSSKRRVAPALRMQPPLTNA